MEIGIIFIVLIVGGLLIISIFVAPNLPATKKKLENKSQEYLELKNDIKLVMSSIAIVGGIFAWIGYNSQQVLTKQEVKLDQMKVYQDSILRQLDDKKIAIEDSLDFLIENINDANTQLDKSLKNLNKTKEAFFNSGVYMLRNLSMTAFDISDGKRIKFSSIKKHSDRPMPDKFKVPPIIFVNANTEHGYISIGDVTEIDFTLGTIAHTGAYPLKFSLLIFAME